MLRPSDDDHKDNSNGSCRSRDEIVKDVLIAVLNGYETRMTIMHSAFVTYEVATNALEELVSEGLLVILPDGARRYKITELGRKMLESS
ncbi:MAG: winged helix-turn-helix domain-containing protein [Nitrososphaera sp.]